MRGALKGCRHVQGWERQFLMAIKNGYNDKTAAQAAGVGTAHIRTCLERDEKFRKRYEETRANAKSQPVGGLW